MKNRLLTKTFFSAALLGAVLNFSSCSDDFSEKDFLAEQYKLANDASARDHAERLAEIVASTQSSTELALLSQKIAQEERQEFLEAYQKAGLLVDASIVVVDGVTENPVQGAKVTVYGKELTSSPQGVANFEDIAIGGGDITIEATGYYKGIAPSIIAYVDPPTDNNKLPVKRKVSVKVKLLPEITVESSTLTLKGKVELDTDLTNPFYEYPADLKLSIDYSGVGSLVPAVTGGIEVQTYEIVNPTFTEGVVDPATGKYEMKVPAMPGIKVMLPKLYKQEITYLEENDSYDDTKPIAAGNKEYLLKTAEAMYGENATGDKISTIADNAPTDALYDLEFSKPTGEGAELSITQTFKTLHGVYTPANDYLNYNFYAGSGYSTIPEVALVAAGTDNIADDKLILNAEVVIGNQSGGDYLAPAAFNFSGGSGYGVAGGVDRDILFDYVDLSGATQTDQPFGTVNVDLVAGDDEYSDDVKVTAGSVVVTQRVLNVHKILAFKMAPVGGTTEPVITPAYHSVDIVNINIVKAVSPQTPGTYSAWPSVTFTGGGAAAGATFEFDANREDLFKVELTATGSDYEVKPDVNYVQVSGADAALTLTPDLAITTGGKLALPTQEVTIRPSEVASVMIQPTEELRATPSLDFTTSTTKLVDANAVTFPGGAADKGKYKNTPTHTVKKNYPWVADAATAAVFDITYGNGGPGVPVIVDGVDIQTGTGKGYMNPVMKTAPGTTEYTVGTGDAGKVKVFDFKYGEAKIEQ